MRKIIGGTLAAAALSFAVFVPKISAAEGVTIPPTEQTTIPLSHTLTNVSGRVNVHYRFSFTASENNPAFVAGQNLDNSAGVNSDADSRTKTVTANCSLNLQNLRFSKVGDYVFTIAESSSSDELNYPIDTNKYDIYFQVTNKLDDNNEPTGELQARLLDYMYDYRTESKVSLNAKFTSAANYTFVTLANKVSGSGADADRYFKYKVDFDNISDGAELTVTGQDREIEYNGEAILSTKKYTVSDEPLYVYLKHGQEITIGDYASGSVTAHEIPQRTTYTIEKMDPDDGYNLTLDGADTATVSKAVTAIGADDFRANNATTATNSKDASINTGIFTEPWPYLLAAFLSFSGLIIFRRLSRAS